MKKGHSLGFIISYTLSSKRTINCTKTFVLYCIIEVGNSKYIINVGAIFLTRLIYEKYQEHMYMGVQIQNKIQTKGINKSSVNFQKFLRNCVKDTACFFSST